MTNGPTKSHGRLSISANAKPRALMEEPTLSNVWTAQVLTLYPEMFPGVLGQSLTGKALKDGLWQLKTTQIRNYASGKHRNVDDTPAGGGPGMVLRADVLGKALDATQRHGPIIALSPRGIPFSQALARDLSTTSGVTLICGRFEGIDQRFLDARNVTEVSVGDYVLTGGELAAQVLIDATIRLIPRVLGNAESILEESFSNGLLEHPQYTRPAEWEGHTIPDVLLSGHHGQIAKWRHSQAEALTKERRPDLWRAYRDNDDADPARGPRALGQDKDAPSKAPDKD